VFAAKVVDGGAGQPWVELVAVEPTMGVGW